MKCCESGSGGFLNPGSRIDIFRIQDLSTHISESLVTIFCVKSTVILYTVHQLKCFLQLLKIKIISNFVKFVATKKKVRLQINFHLL
jgi:hypothetical protein